MGISFRFYGKKRGTRRTGSHRAGSIGELCFSCAMLVLGIIGTISLWCSLLQPEWDVNFRFAQGVCRVTAKQIESKSVDEQELYRPLVTLEYQIGKQIYQTTTYDIRGNWYEEKVEAANRIVRIRVGKDYRFWYDPLDPRRAVLVQGITIWFWLALAIPFSLVFLGAARSVYILYTWRISAERRANIESWRANKRLTTSELRREVHRTLTKTDSIGSVSIPASIKPQSVHVESEYTPEKTSVVESELIQSAVEMTSSGVGVSEGSHPTTATTSQEILSEDQVKIGEDSERRKSVSSTSSSRIAPKEEISGISTACFPWDKNGRLSPGNVLAYRLPTIRGLGWTILVLFALSVVWNLVSIGVLVTVISNWIALQAPSWGTFLGLATFLLVGVGLIGYTWRLYRRLPSRFSTIVEISEYPLQPSKVCDIYVEQHGRDVLRELEILLVCEESAVFGHGTNTRRETARVYQESVFAVQSMTLSSDTPVVIRRQIEIPAGAMHSFQSEHNRIVWMLIVRVNPENHEAFERSFPLLVIPDLKSTRI